MSAHVLRLNSFLLSAGDEAAQTGDEAGTWWWDIYGADFETGAAEPIEVTMRTLLQDGARVVTEGYGNREVTFVAVVGGVNSGALARAEKALALQLGRRGELGWTPSDGWAPESVFDIETSSMTAGAPGDDDDLLEVQHNERVYLLRFVCQPFVRPALPVVVPAIPVPVAALSETVLDAGTTTTRWTARIGTLHDRGSYLEVDKSASPRAVFTPAAPVALTGKPYVSLISANGLPYCDVNGVRATFVGSEAASLTLGGDTLAATRYYWLTEQTTATKIEWGVNFDTPFGFSFADVRIRNLPPYSGTLRQSRRSIEVDGSVRTQGTLQVAAPEGEALGTVVFYSSACDANIPSLRAYSVPNVDNPAAPNADALSGFVEFMGTPTVFEVPVADLAEGKCQILTRLANPFGGTNNGAVTWTAETVVGGAVVGPAITGSMAATVEVGEFKVVALGTVDLPAVDLPDDSTARIRITLLGSHFYDEAWLFNLDRGAVTVVEAGDHSHLWIETATTARPRPAIYVGDSNNRSAAFHDPALVGAWGIHEFAPTLTNTLVGTAGCEGPAVTFEYYPRFMNFVATPA